MLQDLQRLCVKYREDIITVKVNSDHIEESLRNEIGFLKDQLQAEQHTKNTLEETYQHELDESKEELSKSIALFRAILTMDKKQSSNSFSLTGNTHYFSEAFLS